MKKIKLFAALLMLPFCYSGAINAQSFTEGTNSLNLGIGFLGGYTYSGYSGISQMPALSAYYERGILTLGPGKLGVGAGLEYRNLSYKYSFGEYRANWTYTIIGLRGAYHPDFAITDKVDGYIGLALGYGIVSYKDTYYDSFNFGRPSYPSYFYSSFFIGGRYLLTDKFGLFAEIGSGLTVLKAGLNLHF